MSLNSVILSGRLTADIDIKSTPSGVLVGNFSLAVNEFFNQKEYTSFVNCTVFGKTAERLQKYTNKGSLIAIEGVLRQERWESKEGEKKSKISVIANKVEIFDFKKENSGDRSAFSNPTNQKSNNNDNVQDFMDDNDIPF